MLGTNLVLQCGFISVYILEYCFNWTMSWLIMEGNIFFCWTDIRVACPNDHSLLSAILKVQEE